jgi:hypothetical protein
MRLGRSASLLQPSNKTAHPPPMISQDSSFLLKYKLGMVHKAEIAPCKSTAPVIPSGVFGARNPYGLVE